MRVTIRLFARLRDLAGSGELVRDVPHPATVQSVWKVLVSEGQRVAAGDVLLVVESMKMEFSVLAPQDATVHRLMCREGAPVAAGQDVLVLVTED